jgi:hypothetical protein
MTPQEINALAEEWDAFQPAQGTLDWYRRFFAATNFHRGTEPERKAWALKEYQQFASEDAESGLSETELLEEYRNQYEEHVDQVAAFEAALKSEVELDTAAILKQARDEGGWAYSPRRSATVTVVPQTKPHRYLVVLSPNDKTAKILDFESQAVLAEGLPSGL